MVIPAFMLALAWGQASGSPVAVAATRAGARELELARACGDGDEGLMEAARSAAAVRLEGRAIDAATLAELQRAAGEPHTWATAWIVIGKKLDRDAALARLAAWRRGLAPRGRLRCGAAARTAEDGTEALVVIAADALADLTALPMRAHAGQWLTVEARLLVEATGARVSVVGPDGSPRGVPASFHDGRVLARFAPDRPGAFTVQVMADVATGPRPVLEARVFADVAPPSALPERPAPGEEAGANVADPSDALARMIAAVRSGAELGALARDTRLDGVARGHADRMRAARAVAHDAGDGDAIDRVRDANVSASLVGENVAHAATVALAHRALYASPSHRANLLRDDFTHVGVGVSRDPDGSVWVCEVFTRR